MKNICDQLDRVIRINRVASKVTIDELQQLREFLNYGMIFNTDYTWGYTSALLDNNFLETICKECKIPKKLQDNAEIGTVYDKK